MKTRYLLILFTLIVLFGAWLYLSYQIGISEPDKLEKLANLPIYAYVADTTQVAAILSELKPVPGIKNVVYKHLCKLLLNYSSIRFYQLLNK
jgi:hypothetical protein